MKCTCGVEMYSSPPDDGWKCPPSKGGCGQVTKNTVYDLDEEVKPVPAISTHNASMDPLFIWGVSE